MELFELNKKIKNNFKTLYNNYYYKNALEKFNILQNELNINSSNNYHNYTIKKYNLSNKYAIKVFNTIYNNISISNKFHENLCKVGYYSIESYYSNCAVNVVVIEMQMKTANLNLDPINYICTIIENLGELNQHFNEKKKNNDLFK